MLGFGAFQVAPAQAAQSYTFLYGHESNPQYAARWNRCSTIKWGVDGALLTSIGVNVPAEIARLKTVFQEATTTSGYRFKYKGQITRKATLTGGHIKSSAYSRAGGLDIVITYGSASSAGAYTYPTFSGGVWGVGGTRARYARIRGGNHIGLRAQKGSLVLRADAVKQSVQNGQTDLVRALYLHELGHALGLGHVDNSDEIMYPSLTGEFSDYQAGDAAGLRALHSQTCFA